MRNRHNIKTPQEEPKQKPQVTNEAVDIQNGNLFIMTKEQLIRTVRRVNEKLNEEASYDENVVGPSKKTGLITVSTDDKAIYVKCGEELLFGEIIEDGTWLGPNGAPLKGITLHGYLYENGALFTDGAAYELAERIRELGGFIHPSLLRGGSIPQEQLDII